MIFGSCPYCDHRITFAVLDHTPVFSHQTCEACDKTFWEYHSRVDPKAYTEEQFAEQFEFDVVTQTIKERHQKPHDPLAQKALNEAMQRHIEEATEAFVNGDWKEAHA